MSTLTQMAGCSHVHRDSYGRFAGDTKAGDNTSLGWNDFMRMSDFLSPDAGFLLEDTAVFSASFHVIRETSAFVRTIGPPGGAPAGSSGGGRGQSKRLTGSGGETYQGKFVWRIDHFTRLKDLLKKRKITGLCIKSRRFQVGGRDCRLIVYPRGQSQPPNHLSMFLEVTDPLSSSSEWSSGPKWWASSCSIVSRISRLSSARCGKSSWRGPRKIVILFGNVDQSAPHSVLGVPS